VKSILSCLVILVPLATLGTAMTLGHADDSLLFSDSFSDMKGHVISQIVRLP
jgi:hypothetical protein